MQKQLMAWDAKNTRFLIYFLIALYAILFLPFWKPVLLGFLFASACAPVVNALRVRLGARRSRVAYWTVGLSLAFIIGFVALIGLQIYSTLFEVFQNNQSMGNFSDKANSVRDQIVGWANQQQYLASFNIQEKLERSVTGLTNSITKFLLVAGQAFVAKAPVILLNLFVFITMFSVFLVIQPRVWANVSQALRLGSRGKEHFQRFEKICSLALGSVLLTALMQSILVMIGAMIAGFEGPLMIFAMTFILAMIPVIGAGAVPVVLTIVSFVQGNTSAGVIMLVTAVIVGISDNILRAWLFSRAAKSNAAISIVSLIGGITLFGFPGLFIAPVVEQLVMTYAFSDEGEPQPGATTSTEEPAHPDKFVEKYPRRDDFSPSPV